MSDEEIGLSDYSDLFYLSINCLNDGLDRIYFLSLKIHFTTLATNPGSDSIENEMIAIPIHMKWSRTPLHLALTLDTFHRFILTLKSFDHSSSFGIYAVIIARKSGLGEQTKWIGRPVAP